jgi:hypothetical protein
MTRREYVMIYSLVAFICALLLLLALWLMQAGKI